MNAVKEEHYGVSVWVNPKTEMIRKRECLCLNCISMSKCKVAKKLYAICVDDNLAMAVTRCPKLTRKEEK